MLLLFGVKVQTATLVPLRKTFLYGTGGCGTGLLEALKDNNYFTVNTPSETVNVMRIALPSKPAKVPQHTSHENNYN